MRNIRKFLKTMLLTALSVAVVGSATTYANAAGVNAGKEASTYALLGNDAVKRAETEYETLFTTPEKVTAAANTEYSHEFTVNRSTTVYFDVYAPAAVNCAVVISNSAGEVLSQGTLPATDWAPFEGAYVYSAYIENVPAGDYTIKLTFETATDYLLDVYAESIQPTLNATKATITVGFKKTLKVDNTKETVKWTSSKKSVATVSSKGVVKGIKAGKATITATVGDKKLKCTVTVKNNVFTETKLNASSINPGAILQVYRAEYASNGDLIIRCRFVNNTSYHVTGLKNIKIVMRTDAKKLIATYSAKSKSMSVAPGSTKDFAVRVVKSKLKIKSADLRNAYYETKGGEYEYRY